jgi:hypothetical protein
VAIPAVSFQLSCQLSFQFGVIIPIRADRCDRPLVAIAAGGASVGIARPLVQTITGAIPTRSASIPSPRRCFTTRR